MDMIDAELKYFVLASIISADNYKYTEEVKQEIISRYTEEKDKDEINWDNILEPLGEDKNKYLKIFNKNHETN